MVSWLYQVCGFWRLNTCPTLILIGVILYVLFHKSRGNQDQGQISCVHCNNSIFFWVIYADYLTLSIRIFSPYSPPPISHCHPSNITSWLLLLYHWLLLVYHGLHCQHHPGLYHGLHHWLLHHARLLENLLPE